MLYLYNRLLYSFVNDPGTRSVKGLFYRQRKLQFFRAIVFYVGYWRIFRLQNYEAIFHRLKHRTDNVQS